MLCPKTSISQLNSLLTVRTLKVVFKDQSSGALVINTGSSQRSFLGPIHFLLYVNELPRSIFWSFGNISVDEKTINGHTAKIPNVSPITIELCFLWKTKCLERLLSLKLNPDFKLSSSIRSIAKDTWKVFNILYRSSKYLTLCDILSLYKRQKSPKMEYCCLVCIFQPC